VLAHECTHLRHGDHVWNALRSIALAIHWWNPLVWLAVVLSRRDCELACDEGALRRLGEGERIAYGRTLLALLTQKPRPRDLLTCATTMTGGQKSVFERVTRIARAPKRWLWAAVAAVLLTALACACAFGQAEEQAPDTPDGLDAELGFFLGEGDGSSAVGVTGLGDAYVSWDSDSSPSRGFLYFAGNPAFFCPRLAGRAVEGSALWADETRAAVAVVMNVDDPRVVSGTVSGFYIHFIVELENGDILKQVFGSEVEGETLELTDQETVDAARVFARLLTAAEDYYHSGTGEPYRAVLEGEGTFPSSKDAPLVTCVTALDQPWSSLAKRDLM